MVYDANRGVVVMFGGTFPSDTWEWDGEAWTERKPGTLPGPAYHAAAAWDAARGKLVLFGGLTAGFGNWNETWEWDGTNWTKRLPTTSPPGRSEHVMSYDP